MEQPDGEKRGGLTDKLHGAAGYGHSKKLTKGKAMGYEVDFLSVGEESKSGDAIALRFGEIEGKRNEQTVIVVDGGFTESGEQLVELIKKHYQTEQVDLVISTHPDTDHVKGLHCILDSLEVIELWLHQPWNHIEGIADKFTDGRVTDNSIGERLKDSLETAYDLYKKASDKGIKIQEPFTGLVDDSQRISILGPSEEYYEELLIDFEGLPDKEEGKAVAESGFMEGLKKAAEAVVKMIKDIWEVDSITDDGETSAKNNSSVITQLIYGEKRLIFTGDAGIPALEKVADRLDECENSAKISFFQIPHHGSQRNIGPTVLNRIVGEPVPKGQDTHFTALASAAKKGEPKHPNKKVINAFTRRGAKTITTKGSSICHSSNAPDREGYSPVIPEPFFHEVEE